MESGDLGVRSDSAEGRRVAQGGQGTSNGMGGRKH